MPTTEGYNGAFTGAQIDEAIGQVRGKNLPADGVKFTDGETFQEKYDSGELTGPQGATGEQGPKGDTGPAGADGAQGPAGQDGAQGPQGPAGADGAAATISVGTVTTGEAGTSAAVTNSGTSSAAVFNFTIPRGAKGDKGDKGDTGPAGADGAQGPQGEKGATGDTGPQGKQGPAGANGADATINGVNALTLNATGGISGSQSGNTYTLDGSNFVQKTANLSGTDYTTTRARGIQLVTSAPGTLANGCIAIVYS